MCLLSAPGLLLWPPDFALGAAWLPSHFTPARACATDRTWPLRAAAVACDDWDTWSNNQQPSMDTFVGTSMGGWLGPSHTCHGHAVPHLCHPAICILAMLHQSPHLQTLTCNGLSLTLGRTSLLVLAFPCSPKGHALSSEAKEQPFGSLALRHPSNGCSHQQLGQQQLT